MPNDYSTITWDEATIRSAETLIDLAFEEDLVTGHDWTTESTVGKFETKQTVDFVAREGLCICGCELLKLIAERVNAEVELIVERNDGDWVQPGERIASLNGNVDDILKLERTMLNFLGHLSGISTLTKTYCDRVANTRARIYDTRKTLPGYRRLHKFAVQCGGGFNHRVGLHDGILIKDNHIAFLAEREMIDRVKAAGLAVQLANKFRDNTANCADIVVEVEVDSLEQLTHVLPEKPDIVLLDNMGPSELSKAVSLRNEEQPHVVLEASGGINLETIVPIADSGVDRISVGRLTHSAVNVDIGLDWRE